jgi:hypothetical protein
MKVLEVFNAERFHAQKTLENGFFGAIVGGG